MKKICLYLLTPFAGILAGCHDEQYGYRTHINHRIEHVLNEYKTEAHQMAIETSTFEQNVGEMEKIVHGESNWWESLVANPINGKPENTYSLTLDDVILRTITHSSQLKVLSDVPLIRETTIQEAKGAFDTIAFLEGKFNFENNPVGSTLTLGNSDSRFKEDQYSIEGGVRKKFISGTEVEIIQSASRLDNNSTFLTPNPQGQAELAVKITQPLLKGFGIAYNKTRIGIARLDSEIARLDFLHQTESHIIEVTRAYWNLYLARSMYFQKLRLISQTEKIEGELKARSTLDANSNQVLRVHAALAERKAELVRSEAAVRNAQDRLKTLTSDPSLSIYSIYEIIPTASPFSDGGNLDLMESAAIALKNRSEIDQGFKQLHSTLLRHKLSKNELLPTLNLFLEGRIRGLTGKESLIPQSWVNQFDTGGPGGSIGLRFELPLENNIAKAHNMRRRIEIRQQTHQIMSTIETILLEVKVATREVVTSAKDVVAKHESMLAAAADLSAMEGRRDIDIQNKNLETSAYLEFLLDSQDRLNKAEEALVQAQVIHNVSLMSLQKAQGNLLEYNNIGVSERMEHKMPKLNLVLNEQCYR